MKKFDNGNKLVLRFEGKTKTLVCNKTNAKRIAAMYGSDTDKWTGKQVTLYVDQVEFQGDLVDAIRIKIMRKTDKIETSPKRMKAETVDDIADTF